MAFEFDKIQLGSQIKVIDEELGIDVKTTVVKIEHPDLLQPQNMNLELANRTKDITDTLAEVYDRQQLDHHVAMKIGAGQVIVLGEFSVIDWVTGGTTNIKGDYVRTGLLESTNWGTGVGSQFNLNDGTFKLGGSSAPKLSWNGTLLSISGHIVATSGEFTGTLKTTTLEAGKKLTVAGSIDVGDNIDIGPSDIRIKGQLLKFYYDSTNMGILGADSINRLLIYAPSKTLSLQGGTNVQLYANSGWLNLYATQWINVEADMLPISDDNYDLGSPSLRWALIRGKVITSGDFTFENGWRLTETKDNKGIKILRPNGSIAKEWR